MKCIRYPEIISPRDSDTACESLSVLDFHFIRESIAKLTHMSQGREKALLLGPYRNIQQIRYRQDLTREARLFLESGITLDLSGVRDLRGLIRRASLDGVLTGEQISAVCGTLLAIRKIQSILLHRRDLPQLHGLARDIPDLGGLEDELTRMVDSYGFIRDEASRELERLRIGIEECRIKINTALQRIVHRFRYSNILQELLITERNGRLVLMLKSEMTYRVPGIIHDVSDSGATAFVEPLQTISIGNEWKEKSRSLDLEEGRILRNLSSNISLMGQDILLALDLLGEVDMVMAKGRYSLDLGCVPPVFIESRNAYVSIIGARSPILKNNSIPIDISVGRTNEVLAITGPNAGGKTVALKTIGILSAMAQSGLHVPAIQCTMTVLDQIFADIGDQQSVEHSLSSFSSHLEKVVSFMRNATPNSLVLLDELGSSTDPEEGAALAKAILTFFCEKKILCVATTHYQEVAAYVENQPSMSNASVGLDAETLAPTYKLTVGVPGQSHALTIASRIGIDSRTLELAESLLSPEHHYIKELLVKLEKQYSQSGSDMRIAREDRIQAHKLKLELGKKLESIDEDKLLILEQFRSQIETESSLLMNRLRRANRGFDRYKSKPEIAKQQDDVIMVRQELKSDVWQGFDSSTRQWVNDLIPGDYVYVRSISDPVKVLSPLNNDGTLQILVGSMKVRLPTWHITKLARRPHSSTPKRITLATLPDGGGTMELDIRGLRLDEARKRLETFLDQALLKGLSSIRVLHGEGTGALRSMVRDQCDSNPLVKTTSSERKGLSDSVTLVELY